MTKAGGARMTGVQGGCRLASALVGALALVVALGLCGCDTEGVASALAEVTAPAVTWQEARDAQATRNAPAVSAPTVVRDGYLTVGVRTGVEQAPFAALADDGTLVGLDVDLSAALAEEMGLKVRYVAVTDADEALGTSCDVLMDASSAEVPGTVVVGSYAQRAAALYHRGEPVVASVTSLSGARVAVQLGSSSAAALADAGTGAQELPEENLNACFEALKAGEADYVACDAAAGAYLAEGYDDVSLAGTLDVPVAVGVAVSSNNPALQSAVQEAFGTISANGVLDLVRGRWLGDADDLTAESQVRGLSDVSSSLGDGGAETGTDGTAADAEAVVGDGTYATGDADATGA